MAKLTIKINLHNSHNHQKTEPIHPLSLPYAKSLIWNSWNLQRTGQIVNYTWKWLNPNNAFWNEFTFYFHVSCICCSINILIELYPIWYKKFWLGQYLEGGKNTMLLLKSWKSICVTTTFPVWRQLLCLLTTVNVAGDTPISWWRTRRGVGKFLLKQSFWTSKDKGMFEVLTDTHIYMWGVGSSQ